VGGWRGGVVQGVQGVVEAAHEPREEAVVDCFGQRVTRVRRQVARQRGRDHVAVGVDCPVHQGGPELRRVAPQDLHRYFFLFTAGKAISSGKGLSRLP